MTRDFFDCQNCDIVLANLLGTKKVSIGTVMEIAWAYAFNKPMILVLDPENNIHEHPMIQEATGFRVDTVDKAIFIANAVLTDYAGKKIPLP
jgi:nucleoside 2-deoxyribosyltransferase